MRTFILALFLLANIPSLAIAADLAIFSISFSIEGMKPEGLPPGTGDRTLTFAAKFPADDVDAANELFYTHIRILLGEEEQSELQDFARNFARK